MTTKVKVEDLAIKFQRYVSADPAHRGWEPHLVRSMDVVPHAEGAPVLRHHHVAVRHPLDVRTVAQEGPSRLRSDVVPVFVVWPLR